MKKMNPPRGKQQNRRRTWTHQEVSNKTDEEQGPTKRKATKEQMKNMDPPRGKQQNR
jgi:hypothetical protein